MKARLRGDYRKKISKPSPLIKGETYDQEIPKQNVKLKKTPTSMTLKRDPGECDYEI